MDKHGPPHNPQPEQTGGPLPGEQGMPAGQVPLYPTCYMAPWTSMLPPSYYMPGYVGGGLPYIQPYPISHQDGRRVFYPQSIMHPYARQFGNPYGFPPQTIPYPTRAHFMTRAPTLPANRNVAPQPAAQKVAVITREVQTSTDDLNVVPGESRQPDGNEEHEFQPQTLVQLLMPPGDWKKATCEQHDGLQNRGVQKQQAGTGYLSSNAVLSDQRKQRHSNLMLTEVPIITEASRPTAHGINSVLTSGHLLQAGRRDSGIGNTDTHDEESNHDSATSKSGTISTAVTKDGAMTIESPTHTVWPMQNSTVPIYNLTSSTKLSPSMKILPAADECQDSAVLVAAHPQVASSHEQWSLTYEEYMPSSFTVSRLKLLDERLPQTRDALCEGDHAGRASDLLQPPSTWHARCDDAKVGNDRKRSESDKRHRGADGPSTYGLVRDPCWPKCFRPPRHHGPCRRGGRGPQWPDLCDDDDGCVGDEASSSQLSTEEQLPATSTANLNTWAWLDKIDDEYLHWSSKERTSVLSMSLDSDGNHNGLNDLVNNDSSPRTSRLPDSPLSYNPMLPYFGGNGSISNKCPQQEAIPKQEASSKQEELTAFATVFTRRRSSIVRSRNVPTSSSPVMPDERCEQKTQKPVSPPPQSQPHRLDHHDADKPEGPADERCAARRSEAADLTTESGAPPPPPSLRHQALPVGCRGAAAATSPIMRVEELVTLKHRDHSQACASPQEAVRRRRPGAVLKKIAAKPFPKTPFLQDRRPKVTHCAPKNAAGVSARGTLGACFSSADAATAQREAATGRRPSSGSVAGLPAFEVDGGRRCGRRQGMDGASVRQKKPLSSLAGTPRGGGGGGGGGGLTDGQAATNMDWQDYVVPAAGQSVCEPHLAQPSLNSMTSVPGLPAAGQAGVGDAAEQGSRASCRESTSGLPGIAKAYTHIPEQKRAFSRRSLIRNSSKPRSSSRGDDAARQRGKPNV